MWCHGDTLIVLCHPHLDKTQEISLLPQGPLAPLSSPHVPPEAGRVLTAPSLMSPCCSNSMDMDACRLHSVSGFCPSLCCESHPCCSALHCRPREAVWPDLDPVSFPPWKEMWHCSCLAKCRRVTSLVGRGLVSGVRGPNFLATSRSRVSAPSYQ